MSQRKSDSHPTWWDVFISEYLKNGQNAAAAYRHAKPNVTEKTAKVEAQKLLTKPDFKDVLQKSLDKASKKVGMSNEKWLKELCEVANKEVKVDARAKLKALELIGKSQGYFEEKEDHNTSSTTNAITPAQLAEFAFKYAELAKEKESGQQRTVDVDAISHR